MENKIQAIKELKRLFPDIPLVKCKDILVNNNYDITYALKDAEEFNLSLVEDNVKFHAYGIVGSYLSDDRLRSVSVMMYCRKIDTFNDKNFVELADSIAKHICMVNIKPEYVNRNHIPNSILNNLKRVYRRQALIVYPEDKDCDKVEKYINRKFEDYYCQVCLYDQKYYFDKNKTIRQVLNENSYSEEERLFIKRFYKVFIK